MGLTHLGQPIGRATGTPSTASPDTFPYPQRPFHADSPLAAATCFNSDGKGFGSGYSPSSPPSSAAPNSSVTAEDAPKVGFLKRLWKGFVEWFQDGWRAEFGPKPYQIDPNERDIEIRNFITTAGSDLNADVNNWDQLVTEVLKQRERALTELMQALPDRWRDLGDKPIGELIKQIEQGLYDFNVPGGILRLANSNLAGLGDDRKPDLYLTLSLLKLVDREPSDVGGWMSNLTTLKEKFNKKLIEDLGVESLDRSILMVGLQQRFNIKILVTTDDKLVTLKDLITLIDRLRRERGQAPTQPPQAANG